ncbi:MAG TPA: OsmC family protein [Nocardioides sp.]|uniref:OsmC family protein n=1 Tax=Nocardioides sp. TaxID=35761 RepID=UPI002F42B38D
MTTSTDHVERNGVNITQLTQTVGAIQGEPSIAEFRFRATTSWQGGGRSRTEIGGFYGAGGEDTTRTAPFTLVGDEPPVLLGGNSGPNAVEVVLHSLTSCLTVGFVYNAAARGITVRSLDFDIEGELDLHAFLGLSDDTRPGYQHIAIEYHVDADVSDEQIDELCNYVQRTSPVLDIVRNPGRGHRRTQTLTTPARPDVPSSGRAVSRVMSREPRGRCSCSHACDREGPDIAPGVVDARLPA